MEEARESNEELQGQADEYLRHSECDRFVSKSMANEYLDHW